MKDLMSGLHAHVKKEIDDLLIAPLLASNRKA